MKKLMSTEWSFSSTLKQLTSREWALVAILIAELIFLLYLNRSDCIIVEGATYRSPQEIDNFVGGTMHPEVSFNKGIFTSVNTDIVTRGVYKCESGRILAYISYNSDQVAVQLDRRTGVLLWNGGMYVRVVR